MEPIWGWECDVSRRPKSYSQNGSTVTVICLEVLMDKLGRRGSLLLGCLGSAGSMSARHPAAKEPRRSQSELGWYFALELELYYTGTILELYWIYTGYLYWISILDIYTGTLIWWTLWGIVICSPELHKCVSTLFFWGACAVKHLRTRFRPCRYGWNIPFLTLILMTRHKWHKHQKTHKRSLSCYVFILSSYFDSLVLLHCKHIKETSGPFAWLWGWTSVFAIWEDPTWYTMAYFI